MENFVYKKNFNTKFPGWKNSSYATGGYITTLTLNSPDED